MEIRILTADAAEEFRALRLRALREEPEAFGSSWEEENARPLEQTVARLQADGMTAFGGFDDAGRLAGMVRLRRQDGVKAEHKADIISMYVAPEARGRGLGRMLLDAAIAHARATPGIEQLLLAVNTSNTPARNLYLAMGFEPFGREPKALKIGDRYFDEDMMALFLN
ncbi:MAG TPA: GNAT family N-acetyltransferase [Ktedonobacterales bacterium]|nr:GNAT family N-acetyltransferase [Ktedonobacterales bacterium]